MTPVGTFFGVLFVLLFLAAVTSNGALKGPDAFALRWTVITLAVAISGFAAWLRSRPRSVRPSAPVAPNATQQLRTGAADVEAAGRQAIVFRRHFPPRRGASALSFFGGAPIAPRDFRWPRPVSSEQQSKPFSFLMQIDCAAVPAAGRLGMLPDRGVLYFFHDLTWKQADVCRVIYADAQDIQNWRVVDPPDDLGLAFGDKATFSWKWTQSLADGPKLLPKWTFDPVVVELPPPVRDPEEGENAPIWWPERKSHGREAARGDAVDRGLARRVGRSGGADTRRRRSPHPPPPCADRTNGTRTRCVNPGSHARTACGCPGTSMGSRQDTSAAARALIERRAWPSLGEGVYQFWITPADLRARRFDKVQLTADAY